jgi:hypothetical protein
MKKASRATPLNRPENMQTFEVAAPKATHTRPATCEEVECPQYLRGWKMVIDLNTDLGRAQGQYIKFSAGRAYVVEDQRDGLVTLLFSGNQPCFREHRVPNDRPAVYRVKGGDFRGNPLRTPTRVHKKPEYWLEEFQENQDRLKTQFERG